MLEPVYVKTAASGLLKQKSVEALQKLSSCQVCPRQCRVDRRHEKSGVCKTGRYAQVSSHNPHFGEESVLVGRGGSGTIFFTNCSLGCCFCQNFDISHEGWGREVPDEALAAMMLDLQDCGCENINFVTPSHVVPQILTALSIAVSRGLKLPLVYNTSCYDSLDTIRLLEGVIDIYMPDFKFWNSAFAEQSCNAPDYPEVARKALLEMHRQVGDLQVDGRGVARRGLLIRHLVLPNGLADTRQIMRFIAREVSADSYLNIMPQYRPCGYSSRIDGLDRPITREEFKQALQAACEEGIQRLDKKG